MIIGEPTYLALHFDVVEEWNLPGNTWRNGVFSLCLGGEATFCASDVVELKTTIGFYSKAGILDLPISDIKIDAVDLYRNAESYFAGDGERLIDGLFDMTCTAMGDKG
jgi:hypothetical protein